MHAHILLILLREHTKTRNPLVFLLGNKKHHPEIMKSQPNFGTISPPSSNLKLYKCYEKLKCAKSEILRGSRRHAIVLHVLRKDSQKPKKSLSASPFCTKKRSYTDEDTIPGKSEIFGRTRREIEPFVAA